MTHTSTDPAWAQCYARLSKFYTLYVPAYERALKEALQMQDYAYAKEIVECLKTQGVDATDVPY